MKKLGVLISTIFIFFFSSGVMAQSAGADYFSGRWNMLVKGLPNGDTKMIIIIDKKDAAITGAILDSVGSETSKFSKVEIRDNGIIFYFTAQGYDVDMTMIKKDENHVTGSMMGMFDVDGQRIKDAKQ